MRNEVKKMIIIGGIFAVVFILSLYLTIDNKLLSRGNNSIVTSNETIIEENSDEINLGDLDTTGCASDGITYSYGVVSSKTGTVPIRDDGECGKASCGTSCPAATKDSISSCSSCSTPKK